MLPGTYIPTDPREINAFALHKAEQMQFAPAIHEIENGYRDIGLRYHNLSIHSRTQLKSESVKKWCKEAFIVRSDWLPPPITVITHLRNLNDLAKVCIRQGEGIKAQETIQLIQDALPTLRQAIENLFLYVESHTDPDNILPGNPIPEHLTMDNTFQELRDNERAWILALPENRKAVDLGFYTEEEIFFATAWTRVKSDDAPVDLFPAFDSLDRPRLVYNDDGTISELPLSTRPQVGFPDPPPSRASLDVGDDDDEEEEEEEEGVGLE